MADIRVGVIMGSTSDEDIMRKGAAVLEELGLGYEMVVSSAHRNPERTAVWASEAAGRPYGLRDSTVRDKFQWPGQPPRRTRR